MYTWDDLRKWVNDPARTLPELRLACVALGLPSNENTPATRSRLIKKIFAQDDILAESPYNPTATATVATIATVIDLVKCPICGRDVPKGWFCKDCGASLGIAPADQVVILGPAEPVAAATATHEPSSEPVWVKMDGDWDCHVCGTKNRQKVATCKCGHRRSFEPAQHVSAQQSAVQRETPRASESVKSGLDGLDEKVGQWLKDLDRTVAHWLKTR